MMMEIFRKYKIEFIKDADIEEAERSGQLQKTENNLGFTFLGTIYHIVRYQPIEQGYYVTEGNNIDTMNHK